MSVGFSSGPGTTLKPELDGAGRVEIRGAGQQDRQDGEIGRGFHGAVWLAGRFLVFSRNSCPRPGSQGFRAKPVTSFVFPSKETQTQMRLL